MWGKRSARGAAGKASPLPADDTRTAGELGQLGVQGLRTESLNLLAQLCARDPAALPSWVIGLHAWSQVRAVARWGDPQTLSTMGEQLTFFYTAASLALPADEVNPRFLRPDFPTVGHPQIDGLLSVRNGREGGTELEAAVREHARAQLSFGLCALSWATAGLLALQRGDRAQAVHDHRRATAQSVIHPTVQELGRALDLPVAEDDTLPPDVDGRPWMAAYHRIHPEIHGQPATFLQTRVRELLRDEPNPLVEMLSAAADVALGEPVDVQRVEQVRSDPSMPDPVRQVAANTLAVLQLLTPRTIPLSDEGELSVDLLPPQLPTRFLALARAGRHDLTAQARDTSDPSLMVRAAIVLAGIDAGDRSVLTQHLPAVERECPVLATWLAQAQPR